MTWNWQLPERVSPNAWARSLSKRSQTKPTSLQEQFHLANNNSNNNNNKDKDNDNDNSDDDNYISDCDYDYDSETRIKINITCAAVIADLLSMTLVSICMTWYSQYMNRANMPLFT